MPGTVTVIVGTQWGDEGKGKLVDVLSEQMDMCMRFQGGGNAGHTVVNSQGEFKLHQVPCGIFHPDCMCVMGSGTVIDPPALLDELEDLSERGVSITHLLLSDRAHVVMPYHKLLDEGEDCARGSYRVETTKRGIGPAYTDKVARIGLRLQDLFSETVLSAKLDILLRRHNLLLTTLYGQKPYEKEPLLAECLRWGEQLKPRVIDTVPLLRAFLQEDKHLLLEGQLSAMKDIDWGSYPFVTASSPTAAGAAAGAGIPPRQMNRVIGVAKAYSTQVGTGPMPAEERSEQGERLRRLGGEFGATTGRPRRIGWFDAVVTRYVSELNGCTDLAITKLDVLDSLPEIPICVAYRYQGERLEDVPSTAVHDQCEPVYEVLPGWQTSTHEARSLQDLPRNARVYLDHLAELTHLPIHSVGIGPHRAQTLFA